MPLPPTASPPIRFSVRTPAIASSDGYTTVDPRRYPYFCGTHSDEAPALQAALDAARATRAFGSPSNPMGQVRLRGGKADYVIGSPLYLDAPGMGLVGEGKRVTTFATQGCPGILIGLPRGSGATDARGSTYATLASSRWLSSAGFGDGTLPVGWYGVRTNGDALVQVQDGPLACGWPGWPRITLSLGFAAGSGSSALPAGVHLAGCGNAADPSPICLITGVGGATIEVHFRTNDLKDYPYGPAIRLSFPVASPGPWEVDLSLDSTTATAAAWVNGTRVAVTPLAGSATWRAGAGFPTAFRYPFVLGGAGGAGFQDAQSVGFGGDWTFHGMLLADALRYRTDGGSHAVGTPQRVIAAGAATSGLPSSGGELVPTTRYRFTAQASGGSGPSQDCFCFYNGAAFTPSQQSRLVGFRVTGVDSPRSTTGRPNWGYLLNSPIYDGSHGGQYAFRVSDLSVSLSSGYHAGPGVGVGLILYADLHDLVCSGGSWGISSIDIGATYTVDGRGLTLSGTEGAYRCYYQLGQLVSTTVEAVGGSGLAYGGDVFKLIGSALQIEHTLVGSTSAATIARILGTSYGGKNTFRDLALDNEGYPLSDAAFYSEPFAFGPTSLEILSCYIGTIGSAPLVKHRDRGSLNPLQGGSVFTLTVDNSFPQRSTALLDIDGPGAHGVISNCHQLGPFPTRLVHRRTWPGGANVVIEEVGFRAPPAWGAWFLGAHRLRNSSAVAGTFREWVALAEGRIGSPIGASFGGVDPVRGAGKPLGGVAAARPWVACRLSDGSTWYGSSWGGPGSQLRQQMLARAVLGGAAPSVPATHYLALSTNPITPDGSGLSEPIDTNGFCQYPSTTSTVAAYASFLPQTTNLYVGSVLTFAANTPTVALRGTSATVASCTFTGPYASATVMAGSSATLIRINAAGMPNVTAYWAGQSIAFGSGLLAGTSATVTSGTLAAGIWALTLSAALPLAPAAGDTLVVEAYTFVWSFDLTAPLPAAPAINDQFSMSQGAYARATLANQVSGSGYSGATSGGQVATAAAVTWPTTPAGGAGYARPIRSVVILDHPTSSDPSHVLAFANFAPARFRSALLAGSTARLLKITCTGLTSAPVGWWVTMTGGTAGNLMAQTIVATVPAGNDGTWDLAIAPPLPTAPAAGDTFDLFEGPAGDLADPTTGLAPGGIAIGPGITPAIPAGSLVIAGDAGPAYPGIWAPGVLSGLLGQWFGGVAWTAPAGLYLALATNSPSTGGTPVEPLGGNYSRTALALAAPSESGINYALPQAQSSTAPVLPVPSSDWGTLRSIAVFDAAVGGRLIAWASLALPDDVATGDTIGLAASALLLQL